MTVNPLPNVEIEEPDIMDYESTDITKSIRASLKDGSILEIMIEVTAITKMGHDINTGMPVYSVASQNIVKTKYIPEELFKKAKANKPSGYQ